MEWTPFNSFYWIAAAVGILFAAVAWKTLTASPGPGLGRRIGWLVLRGALLAILLLILLNPHRVERREFREPQDVAILLDDSASMALRDDTDSPPRTEQLKENIDAIRKIADEEVRLRWYRFAEDAGQIANPESLTTSGSRSDIGKALETALGDERTRSLGAAILVSDGQTRDAEAARRAARFFKEAKIPLYTRLVGTPEEAPDLRLTDLSAAQASLYTAEVRLNGILHSSGFDGKKALLRVTCEGRMVHESFLSAEGEAKPFEIIFPTPFKGFQIYEVELEPLEGERLADNNSGFVGVDVQDRKIRVINMEGTPGRGHTLENALESDPDIEVTSLFFPQSESFAESRKVPFTVDANNRKIFNIAHPQKGYPKTLEEMLQYDVIINSDIYKEAFTAEQLDLTVSLVEEHGGGFVMIGGYTAFGAGNYDETVIDKLMPVDVYGNEGWDSGFFGVKVPEDALDHPIMTMGTSKAETAKVWSEIFPGFYGLNTVNRPKPGAKVLAVNPKQSNQYGPLIVFAVQQIGRGRTMAFTSDTTPGWGVMFESKFGTPQDRSLYYRRFWNQSIRWLAAERIRRKSGDLRLDVSGNVAVPGEFIRVRIPFPQSDPNAPVTLSKALPGGEASPVSLIRDELTRTWIAQPPAKEEGKWIYTARMERLGLDPLFSRALVNVVSDKREQESTAANRELMEEIAELGGGRLLGDDSEKWFIKVDPLGSRIVEYGQRSVWDRWWVICLLIALITAEWAMRRRWIGVG
ncbi:MAG: glutamine amidotransferase [Akkermansiaceae bacterium]